MSGAPSGRKRQLANFLDPAFLNALIAPPNDDTTTNTSNDTPVLHLTNGAVQALHDCQEAFIRQLTQELKDITRNSDNDDDKSKQKVRHVQPHHVEAAMRAMGLDDVLEEALQYLRQKEQQENDDNEDEPRKPKAKRKRTAKSKGKFTAEMEAEQERLLQASRQKLDKS